MIVMAGLALFFGVESGKLASRASSRFAMNLRQAMYEKYPYLCEGADYAGQCHGDDLSDPSPLCLDLSGGDHRPGFCLCPDLIEGKPGFKKGFP